MNSSAKAEQASYRLRLIVLILCTWAMIILFVLDANAQDIENFEMPDTARHCTLWEEFDNEQIAVIVHSYFRGLEYDMQRTLAAIAIQESKAGKYPISLQDPAAGVHHITIRNILAYLEWEDTPYNRNRAASTVIANPDLSADIALTELLWWHNRHDGNWELTWRSYNAGYSWTSQDATNYYNNIRYWTGRLADCGWL